MKLSFTARSFTDQEMYTSRFVNNELNLSNIKVYGFDYDASTKNDYRLTAILKISSI